MIVRIDQRSCRVRHPGDRVRRLKNLPDVLDVAVGVVVRETTRQFINRLPLAVGEQRRLLPKLGKRLEFSSPCG